MFDVNQIKTQLIDIVGWHQNTDPGGWQLTGLTTSSSGLWYNDIHPMLTIDNLISIAPEFDTQFDTQVEINVAFTEWLQQKTEAGIAEAIDAWLTQKSNLRTASGLLSNDQLFVTTGNFSDIERSTGGNVGHEFVVSRSKSLRMKIKKIGLQFDTNQTITLKLFKSDKRQHVETIDVDYQGVGSVQWVDVSWILKGEGSYLLAYDQRTITGNAINGVRDFTFASSGLTSFPTGRYYRATAFSNDAADLSQLWDLSGNSYTVTTNYGLNVAFDVSCEYSEFISDQKQLFKTIVALNVAMKLLRELAFNPNSRVNRNEANVTRQQLLFEVDGDTQGKDGFSLMGKYKNSLNSIAFDNSNIDKICLPCRRRGIRWKANGPG